MADTVTRQARHTQLWSARTHHNVISFVPQASSSFDGASIAHRPASRRMSTSVSLRNKQQRLGVQQPAATHR